MNKYPINCLLILGFTIVCNFISVSRVNALTNGHPPDGESCIVTAGNRSAPLATDGSYTIFGVPGNLGAIRARATCSDGSVGQSDAGFTDVTQSITIELGPIQFGESEPVPIAVKLGADENRLDTGDVSQLSLLAINANGTTHDVSNRSQGTVYTTSNKLLAPVSENGLVSVVAEFSSGSSARIVAGATSEGSVSSTYIYEIGPVGILKGTVYQADGITAVEGAQVSILRLQPMAVAGTVITNAIGKFELAEVNAGSFRLSVLDPATGDRALSQATIETEGQVVDVSLILNGLGQVNVSVLNGADELVIGSEVTLTSLGAYRKTTTTVTNSEGVANFVRVPVGDFTVSTRDPATGLLGMLVDKLNVDETKNLTLHLQETGTIGGVVYDSDGVTPLNGIQVRIFSSKNGVVTHSITGSDGVFSFDELPKSSGPFTLDAFVDGRLRSRLGGIIFLTDEDVVERDIILSSVGTVKGVVKGTDGSVYVDAQVSLLSLGLSFDTVTNNEGRFIFPAVPIGNFEMIALTQEGRTGTATGQVNVDNGEVEKDIIILSNTLVGTVYLRNGLTPVGAGVDVYLAPRSLGPLYSYQGVSSVRQTTTNENGEYGFAIDEAGSYIVQAESNLDRGRSFAILVNLDPSQPFEADIVYLAKGNVSGVVRSADGVVQAGALVAVHTEGLFDAVREIQTDINGLYMVDGVFAGNVTVTAKDPITNLAGIRRGRLNAEGESISIDVTLEGTGSVEGRILNRDGTVVSTPLRLKIRSNGLIINTLDLDNGNFYQIDLLPIGDIELIAEKLSTNDKGRATSRIDFSGETNVLDVQLNGQGSLRVELVNNANQPIEGAIVTATTLLPFPTIQEITSNEDGVVIFTHVFAGDFQISANKFMEFGSLTGSASGTVISDQEVFVPITMDESAVGKISGKVYESDGATLVSSGWVIRMSQESFLGSNVTTTNENGEYSFPLVNAGNYVVDVLKFLDQNGCPQFDRIRGRAANVVLATAGEEITADIQIIGEGKVQGVVTDIDGNPVAEIKVQLTNPDPVYGSNVSCSGDVTYNAVTNTDGEYFLDDVPPGNFTTRANNTSQTLRAEGSGRVNFDGDEVEHNLVLIDNAVTMPYNFYDANGFISDVSGNGGINAGTSNVFAAPAPNTGGMLLDIVFNDVPVPFINRNGSIGKLSTAGSQIEVDDLSLSGLLITRKITTPRAGYFSRYLETFKNPTNETITVSVRVRSHHRESVSSPRVTSTSDGDQVLSVANQEFPDRWIIIDDNLDGDPFATGSIPAMGHVFDGANAQTQVASAAYELIGQTGRLTYQWDNIVVPAGEQVILMHFVFSQINRTGANQAAMRLVDLPPESINDLTTQERALILNFNVPTNSAIEPLPNLDAGVINGKVLSGDGVTGLAYARVEFKSKHPLFSRSRGAVADSEGLFSYQSTLDGTFDNYVIPVYAFDLSAVYLKTGLSTEVVEGNFGIGEVHTTQDLILSNTGNIRGIVKRHNSAIVAGAKVTLCQLDDISICTDANPNPSNYTESEENGSYQLLANTPRDYFLFAEQNHPQGGGVFGREITTVTAGNVVIVNIVMEETGSVSGVVRTSDGTPVSLIQIDLEILGSNHGSRGRRTISDTAGFFRFNDVPLGTHQLLARDSLSGAEGTADVEVVVDQETVQDIQLDGAVFLDVHVEFARGVSAPNSRVTIIGVNDSLTDSNGLAQFQLNSGSTYQVRALHPDYRHGSEIIVNAEIELINPDETVSLEMILPSAGSVLGIVSRPDGTTFAGGVPYNITQIRGSPVSDINNRTNDLGQYRENGLPLGDYKITAYDAEQDRFADAEFTVVTDGEEVQVDMTLLDESIQLPANLFDANRFKYDVQQSGSLLSGSGAFNTGGMKLFVSGTSFTGKTSARLEAGQRQFSIKQESLIDGIQVTRKVYVPTGAYFARYLEIFENSTAEDITVDILLEHSYPASAIIASSTGDTSLSSDDSWFIIDDDIDDDIKLYRNQTPAIAHIFADDSGLMLNRELSINYTGALPTVQQQWNQVSIPANGRITLMHFAVQQINQLGAQAAVTRLSQLPPEALSNLRLDEILSIANFDIPENAVSTLGPLPSLTGSVSGIALEGDEQTPVVKAYVTVQSMHPLFNRVWGKRADFTTFCSGPGTTISSLKSGSTNTIGFGRYSIEGQLSDVDSIPIPVGSNLRVIAQEATSCYGLYSGHPFTRVTSQEVLSDGSEEKNVIFNSAIITGTVVGSSDYSIFSGSVYRSIDDIHSHTSLGVPSIKSDGTYVYPGLPPGTYDLLFQSSHPDGFSPDLLRGSNKNITVSLGDVLVADIMMQTSGGIQGTVVTADGAPSVNTQITLKGTAANQSYDQCDEGCVVNTLAQHKGKRPVNRKVNSDGLGSFNFTAVPVGDYTMTYIDTISGAIASVEISVLENQIAIQNIILPGSGSITVTVLDTTGNPVIDSKVYLEKQAPSNEEIVGLTDAQGQLVIANIPFGNYNIRITDPRDNSFRYLGRTASGTIEATDQANSHEFILGSLASIIVSVLDLDNGGAPIRPVLIDISDASGERHIGVFNSFDAIEIGSVPQGAYSILAKISVSGIIVEKTVTGEVRLEDDNQTLLVDINFNTTLTSLPLTLYDGNNNSYKVDSNSSSFDPPQLLINGEYFEGTDNAINQLEQREFIIASQNLLSGLDVSRKVYVPRNGYFVRYIEILENTTESAITIDLEIQNNISSRELTNTSNGDLVIDNGGIDPDLWFVSGWSNVQRNHAFITGDGNTVLPLADLSHIDVSSVKKLAVASWTNITVPAHSRVKILHFYSKQENVESATASAERLIQLPPEALTGLVINDVNEIINFALPIDLTSPLDLLPELNGTITGKVYEGDGVTPVANSIVSVISNNLLFPSYYTGFSTSGLKTDSTGKFSISGIALSDNERITIPIDSTFLLGAFHLSNTVENIELNVEFEQGETTLTQDLFFETGSVQGTTTGLFLGLPNELPRVSVFNGTNSLIYRKYVDFADNGFFFNGLGDGDYRLEVSLKAPENGSFLTGFVDNVSVVAGVTTSQNIEFEPNGAITGKVFSSDGIAKENIEISIEHEGTDYYRYATTDILGKYELGALPVGNYIMTINDHDIGIELVENIVIFANQFTTHDITLPALGTVTITVELFTGEPISGITVYLDSPEISGTINLGESDEQGLIIAEIPVGSYTLRATHLSSGIESSINGLVGFGGEESSISLVLSATADLQFFVSNIDQSNAPIQNVEIEIVNFDSINEIFYSGISDIDGLVRFNFLENGNYRVKVRIGDQYETTFMKSVVSNPTNELITHEIKHSESQIVSGNFSYEQAHSLYQIEAITGDELSLSIRGVSSDNGGACNVVIRLYDENKNNIATGFGSSIGQTNLKPKIDLIPIVEDGLYTVMLSTRFTDCFSGSYKLGASVLGQSIPISHIQNSGEVSGTLFQSDGINPIVNEWVRIETTDGNPMFSTQKLTNANGQYLFERVPVGNFLLTYPLDQNVTASGNIANVGEQITQDLILVTDTILNINVLDADSNPVAFPVELTIEASDVTRFTVFTNNQGQYTYSYEGNDIVHIQTTSYFGETANQYVAADRGNTLEINLLLIDSEIQGMVYYADGSTTVAGNTTVKIYYQDGTFYDQTNTNSMGQYVFEELPNNEFFILEAIDPINNVLTRVSVESDDSQVVTKDIIINGNGVVFGRLTGVGDIPIENATIIAEYEVDIIDHIDGTISVLTNENGDYHFPSLPIGRQLSIVYSQNMFSGLPGAFENTNLIANGDSSEVNLMVEGAGISLKLIAADGQPIDADCEVNLTYQFTQVNFPGYSCDSHFNFAGFHSGAIEIEIVYSNHAGILFSDSFNLVEEELLTASRIVSVSTGVVTYFNGSVVVSPYIATDNISYRAEEDGSYRIVGMKEGDFSIAARDFSTPLTNSINVTLIDTEIPIINDIQMPASGTIRGQVLNIDGSPKESISFIYAASSSTEGIRTEFSDALGHYEISNLLVGKIELTTFSNDKLAVASVNTKLQSDGEIMTQNLQFETPGSISGIVTDENAVNVGSCADILMKPTAIGPINSNLDYETSTNESGLYEFSKVDSTEFMLIAKDECLPSPEYGIDIVQVPSNTDEVFDIEYGNAVKLGHQLNSGGDNFAFSVSREGRVSPYKGSFSHQPFNNFKVSVNNKDLNSQSAAFIEADEKQLVFGPSTTFGLSVKRKIFSPSSGEYVRLLESISNTSNEAIDVEIKLSGKYGKAFGDDFDSNISLAVDPKTTMNRYAVHQYEGPILLRTPAITGYVFSDVNDLAVITTDFKTGRSYFEWKWNATIEAGETLNYLSYIVVSEPGDATAVINISEAINNGTHTGMYEGLSEDDKSNVVNFDVPE